MINFMLADLCCPSWQFLALFFPVEVIIFYFYFLVSGRLTNTIQGQTAFFCLIHIMLWNNHRIEHHNIYESHIHNDDILLYANHFVLRTQSRQSPNIHASMAAWLVAHEKKTPPHKGTRSEISRYHPDFCRYFLQTLITGAVTYTKRLSLLAFPVSCYAFRTSAPMRNLKYSWTWRSLQPMTPSLWRKKYFSEHLHSIFPVRLFIKLS